MKLNSKTVGALTTPPGKKDILIFDEELPGFGVRVSSNGSKTFLIQYMRAGEKRRMPLGKFGVITAEEARKQARMHLGTVAGGDDPVALRQAKEAENRHKVALERAKAAEQAYTLKDMIGAWETAIQGENRPSYLREAMNCMRRNLTDWLDRPASEITKAEVVRRLDKPMS